MTEAPDDIESDLDALDASAYSVDAKPVGVLDGITLEPEHQDDDNVETLLFTATNPDGTVSVTALMNGQILRVSLSATVTSMTESMLADEILVLASMSRLQALAGQHALIAALMGRLGHDPAAIHSFLERELRLPSPESVNQTRAEIFASRYFSESD
ncbi:YbaB/EbfC family DNA-binding protein [Mycobacterium sp. 236(2023)]|uniref:YbaB/EbfC family DNA-binding protein n=1 Tax=Mycobacterium sp. 236(2023) TaxID=3038163 RepID=UPI0024154837|nr:YbaB/EbfC family DNA-binding protein [Mycobacterium sp. 236(2023)]MDG4668380.1 YbaB/EbfC family DNA-binding protein [Mycobacterium sp. 236(2023)]